MAMDYATLVAGKDVAGSIKNWFNTNSLDVEGILLDAQTYLSAALRTREMRQSATVTIAQGASSAALPTRFLDPIHLQFTDGYGDIQHVLEQALRRDRLWQSDGTLVSTRPLEYAIFGEAIQFECQADAAYTADFLFYQQPAFLDGSHATNFLNVRYPHLLRRACLMWAADYRDDAEAFDRNTKLLEAEIARINIENDFVRRGAAA
jgi:hypothetical protein